MRIKFETSPAAISVQTPFGNRAFCDEASAMGGLWTGASWSFRKSEEERVRQLCREHYGDDGLSDPDLVIIGLLWARQKGFGLRRDVMFEGRRLVSAAATGGMVLTGCGVTVMAGGFVATDTKRGPKLSCEAGTMLWVHDVPRAVAERVIRQQKRADACQARLEQEAMDRMQALLSERKQFLARIAEIDGKLAEIGVSP